MSEIDVRSSTPAPGEAAPAMLVSWARAATAAHELAVALCQTNFVPEHFYQKPQEATAAILHGAEIGLSPLAALQGIYVIHGKPALYAKVKLAIAQAHGHNVWTEDETTTRVVACGQRKGSSKIERVTWTIDRAQKAGYTRQNPNYSKDPQAMLWARAVSQICSRVAAAELAGLATVEELWDEGPTPDESPPAIQVGRRTAQRRPLTTVPLPEPPPLPGDDEPEPAETAEVRPSVESELPLEDQSPTPDIGVESPPDMINKAQLRKMHVTFKDLGIIDRDTRRAITKAIVGRDVESASFLTKDEASVLIDKITTESYADLMKLATPSEAQTGEIHTFKGLDPDEPCPDCGLPYDDTIHGDPWEPVPSDD